MQYSPHNYVCSSNIKDTFFCQNVTSSEKKSNKLQILSFLPNISPIPTPPYSGTKEVDGTRRVPTTFNRLRTIMSVSFVSLEGRNSVRKPQGWRFGGRVAASEFPRGDQCYADLLFIHGYKGDTNISRITSGI